MIVGWRAARSRKTDLPLDALEMALWNRQRMGRNVNDLVHHSDAGSQYTSIRYTQRMIEAGLNASIGSVGDSYDNALAESVNGLYKTELVYWEGPWKGADDLELATLGWVDWSCVARQFRRSKHLNGQRSTRLGCAVPCSRSWRPAHLRCILATPQGHGHGAV